MVAYNCKLHTLIFYSRLFRAEINHAGVCNVHIHTRGHWMCSSYSPLPRWKVISLRPLIFCFSQHAVGAQSWIMNQRQRSWIISAWIQLFYFKAGPWICHASNKLQRLSWDKSELTVWLMDLWLYVYKSSPRSLYWSPHVTLLVESSHAERHFIHYGWDNSVCWESHGHCSAEIAVYIR